MTYTASDPTLTRHEQVTPVRPEKIRQLGWWPFIVPAAALVVAFFTVPFLLNLRFAFTDWSGYSDAIAFNGLDNFRSLIDQDILWQAIKVTLLYALLAM